MGRLKLLKLLTASILATLILLVVAAVTMNATGLLAQTASSIPLFGPLQKAFFDPTQGVLKSYDVQWLPTPGGSTDTFISLNDFAGEAFDDVGYKSNVLTLTRLDGGTESINISGGGGGGSSVGISTFSIDPSPNSVAINIDSHQAVILEATSVVAGVMSAADRTRLEDTVTDVVAGAGLNRSSSGTTVTLNVVSEFTAGEKTKLAAVEDEAKKVVANPTGTGGASLSRVEISGVDYQIQSAGAAGAQGAQGIYLACVFRNEVGSPPGTPVGGEISVASGFVTIPPANWTREPSANPAIDESTYRSCYRVNPANSSGSILNPTWGAPARFGTHGATGRSGTDGTDGTDGTAGTDGTDGTVGPTGPQGARGDQGPQGAQGRRGRLVRPARLAPAAHRVLRDSRALREPLVPKGPLDPRVIRASTRYSFTAIQRP